MSLKDYLGTKNGSGVYQAIINLLPPHDTYIEGFLGTGGILKRKAPAQRNIGVDLFKPCIDECNYAAGEFHHGDFFEFIDKFDFCTAGQTVCYLYPPYINSTRSGTKRYEHDFTDEDHKRLLALIIELPCYVLVSGYKNTMYDHELAHWFSHDFQSMTRGGVRTETVWCNFKPSDIHYHTYAGKNFTDRQRMQRKAQSWAKRFEKLPPGERQAILSALLGVA